jgi:predicted metal-dependent HD superfamily phosphohydrolase
MTRPRPVPSVGQLWRHYKGGLYRIRDAGKAESDQRLQVLYRSASKPGEGAWVRDMAEFLALLPDGQPRFVLVLDDRVQAVYAALDGVVPAEIVDHVLACYDEPWRTYHSREHLAGIFSFAARYKFQMSPAQRLAALFHDAVYIPGAATGANEAASACLLRLLCAQAVPGDVIDAACAIVGDTVTHEATHPASPLVLDLDLCGFVTAGQGLLQPSELVFDEYRPLLPTDEAQARKVFWAARTKVLASLLARKRLYVSTEFQAYPAFETAAREFLEREVQRGQAEQFAAA